MWERSRQAIYDRVHAVASRGIVPLVLGGDHAITWPSASAVADVLGHGRVGLIHFDAHADTADDDRRQPREPRHSDAAPHRERSDSGRNFVQVGLRGYWPPADVVAWMREQEMRTHFMQEIWEDGIHAVIDRVIAEALDGPEYIYLSVDIDVLDPGFAPGTGTPEPGGMSPVDLLRIVRRIATDTRLVGVDVVEVAPAYDHADTPPTTVTASSGSRISGMAKRRANGLDTGRPT